LKSLNAKTMREAKKGKYLVQKGAVI